MANGFAEQSSAGPTGPSAPAAGARTPDRATGVEVDWDAVARHFGLPGFEGPWCVLHTRSRQEKALSEDLHKLGVPHFLPLYTSVRYYNGRKARVRLPLFPSYVFLRGPVELAYRAEKTRRLVRIIKVADPGELAWELRHLALALMRNAPVDPYPGVVRGARVEVISGPFAGLQGVVVDRTALDRVHLQVGMLGVGVILVVDAGVVRLIE